jgi:HAD superfamily hydrolase (TIGR01509 family)
MLNWKHIDHVLLDMDGTLLDLNFDNHFWLEFVPSRYAEANHLTPEQAKAELTPRFKAMEGQLEWYCLDYWSHQLKLDIAGLKTELSGLIRILPHVVEFLEAVKESGRPLWLVTNAHPDALAIKMEKTCLMPFFDQIICSHNFNAPKEQQAFWHALKKDYHLDKTRTLMVDDSLPVLTAAQQFGIQYLIAVRQPDSGAAKRDIKNFLAIDDFRALMPVL